MIKQINFNNYKEQMTEEDIDQICAIVTYRCRIDTLRRVRSILTYGKGTIPSYGILERLIKENGKWSYVAGQSYTDEIKTVREIIIKGK